MFARLAAFFTNTLDTFIAAQQMRALASLTDRQLRDIGLTRSEIPAYAASLVQRKNTPEPVAAPVAPLA